MTQDKTGGLRGRVRGNRGTIRVSRKGKSTPIRSPSIVTFSVRNTARDSFNEGSKVEQVQSKIIFSSEDNYQQSKLPRAVMGSPSLRVFQNSLDFFSQKIYVLLQTEINSRSSIATIMLKITTVPSGFTDCVFQVTLAPLKRCIIISC